MTTINVDLKSEIYTYSTHSSSEKLRPLTTISALRHRAVTMERKLEKWVTGDPNQEAGTGDCIGIRETVALLKQNIDKTDQRPTIPLGHGDPSPFPSFRTASVAEDAIVECLRSAKFNCYALPPGMLPARRAIADHLSQDLPYQLSPDDAYVTMGCKQAIKIIVQALSRPGANILLPRPCWPRYESYASFNHLEVRRFDLLQEKGWEVDLHAVEALADDNTIAMVIINPGNPCGNVYTYQHLKEISETARKLGIIVIADEVYGHLTFGDKPFVPMGVFGSVVPVLTVGSISKRWSVPGWRLGWIAICDPNGTLLKFGIVESIKKCSSISSEPPTFIQAAVPQILSKTPKSFFSKVNTILKEVSGTCYDTLKEIPCITCPQKPEGSMFLMVKLEASLLEDIRDDMEFCLKLAKEESVIILPGTALGVKNWLRVTFSVEPSSLEDGLGRIKAFCQRHSKKQ